MLTFSDRWLKRLFMDQEQNRTVLETHGTRKPRIRRMSIVLRRALADMESEVNRVTELTNKGRRMRLDSDSKCSKKREQ